MPPRNMKALVLWTREKKTGIEKLANVPEKSRFVNAVTPVLFSGDKKHYPAKILMISDNDQELEAMADAVALQILKEKVEQNQAIQRTKRVSRRNVNPSAATEREIAVALGSKAPFPKHLQPAHQAAQKAAQQAKAHHSAAQDSLDDSVMDTVRKNLFNGNTNDRNIRSESHEDDKENARDSEEDIDGSLASGDDHDDAARCDDEDVMLSPSKRSHEKWCGCKTCNILQKYDNPMYQNFFSDLNSLFKATKTDKKLFLELKEIPADVKKVELTCNSGVFIPLAEKEQIKVDFRNKPSALIRETLFALYGKETFKVLNITAKGQKKDSYAIPDHVLRAVRAFVNRHVSKDMALKSSVFIQTINKRAVDWRKPKTPSPKSKETSSSKKKKLKKVISTSPFKSSPLKEGGSDAVLPSPRKATPRKSQATPTKSKETALPPLNISPPKRSATPSSGPSPLKTPRRGGQTSASPVKDPRMPAGHPPQNAWKQPSYALPSPLKANFYMPQPTAASQPAPAPAPYPQIPPGPSSSYTGEQGPWNGYQGSSHFNHMPWMQSNEYWGDNGPTYGTL